MCVCLTRYIVSFFFFFWGGGLVIAIAFLCGFFTMCVIALFVGMFLGILMGFCFVLSWCYLYYWSVDCTGEQPSEQQVCNWILLSCQPQRVATGQTHTVTSQYTSPGFLIPDSWHCGAKVAPKSYRPGDLSCLALYPCSAMIFFFWLGLTVATNNCALVDHFRHLALNNKCSRN